MNNLQKKKLLCRAVGGPVLNKSMFRKWSLKNHPDKCPPETKKVCNDRFVEMNDAFDTVSRLYSNSGFTQIHPNLCDAIITPKKNTPPKANSTKPKKEATPPKASSSKPKKGATPPKASSSKPKKEATPPKARSDAPKRRGRPPKPCSELSKKYCAEVRAKHKNPSLRCKYNNVLKKCVDAV